MAYTDIDDPSAHFQVATYTGNGSHPRNLTNDGNSDLKPDFLWLKKRNEANTDHVLANSSIGWNAPKGVGYSWEDGPFGGQMASNSTGAESTPAATYGYISAALTDGFTAAAGGTNGDVANQNTKTYVAWQWKANGGTTTAVSASGTGEASINASTHQVNTDAGFSIITYTGRSDQISNGQETKVTHGLGVKPEMAIIKKRNSASTWYVLGKNATETSNWGWSYNEFLALNETNAVNGVNYTGNLQPTTTHIPLGKALINDDDDDYIAYVFAGKQGYSKFGKYFGNGNTNGPFVYTGFKPAFVMVKIIDTHGGTAGEWQIYDHKRPGYNFPNYNLSPNNATAEYTGESYHNMHLLSNGFKIILTDVALNTSGKLYGYAAFAENPFVTSTGVPTTAR